MPPNLTIEGATPIAAWIPSLDTTGNGTTTLYDLTGNGYDGTLTNMDAATDWVADTSNGGVRALDFDGSNDYVAASVSGFPTLTAFTVSMWVKYSTQLIANARIFDIYINASNRLHLIVDSTTGKLRFFGRSGGVTAVDITKSTRDDDGAWHHVIMRAASSNDFELLVDNTSAGTDTSGSLSLAVASGSLWLGSYAAAALTYTGRIDDVRVFNSSLSSTQIAALYNSGNGRGVVGSSGSALLPFLLAHFSQGIM